MRLGAADGLIVLIYLAFVVGVGVIASRAARTGGEFFLAGRSIPAWVCGLAYISANLGAQEVIGMGASGAKYGLVTAHFYWIGAIPAMVFVGVFMMPFYYGSRARSAPEYLKLRFDEKTRALNAASFAVMTVLLSGISMYAMARLVQTLRLLDAPLEALGLPASLTFHAAIAASAVVVLAYILLGGLRGAIYNEVLQFFLIVAGFAPLVWLGLRHAGGWTGLKASLPPDYLHVWAGMGRASTNRLGVDAFALVSGLGFVLSFGYWCSDFLVVQRAMAADSMTSARQAPLIAALAKMFFPALVIVPGLIAMSMSAPKPAPLGGGPQALSTAPAAPAASASVIPVKLDASTGRPALDARGAPQLDYDLAVPALLERFYPPGLLGLGVTALLASFMSGMAGNVTAFNTVFTYDLYQAHVRRNAPDRHYLLVGRLATVAGVLASVAAAYVTSQFNNIMDLIQLICAFVNAPVFATFLLGMFWRRANGDGAFAGLVLGILGAALHHGLTLPEGSAPGIKGAWIVLLRTYPSEMAQNFWTAIIAFGVCFTATVAVSLAGAAPGPEQLSGLTWSATDRVPSAAGPLWARPVIAGAFILAVALVLNIVFW